MTTSDRWNLKIHAFLHDPPYKPLALGRNHARQGAQIAERITGAALSGDWIRLVEQADHLAAGADRHSWLQEFKTSPRTELEIVHPLEGKPILQPGAVTERALQLTFPPECVDAAEDSGPKLGQALTELSESRLRFLVMWRFLPELLTELEGKERNLGLLWPLLPADSRMPDHSVLVHDSLVSALASILAEGEKAALLRVQFAPVQEFIEASRKLRDLWASSTILAETTWKALEPIVEEFGPDHVVFPSLRYEPRFDRWLSQQLRNEPLLQAKDEKEAGGSPVWKVLKTNERHLDRALRTPSLPNVLTAIVPYGRAEAVAKQIEAAMRAFWVESIAAAAREAGDGREYVQRAEHQARSLLQVFWSVIPWPLNTDPQQWVGSENPRLCWHKAESNTAKTLHTIEELEKEAKISTYKPNAGLLYADLNDQAGLLVDAVKRERAQHVSDEGGLKCSCCGERQVLGGTDFWIQRTEGFSKRKDQRVLTDQEQLCGPCTWKRSFQLESGTDEERRSLGGRHPSTGDVAAAQFKLDVLRECANGNKALLAAVEDFVRAAEQDSKEGSLDDTDLSVFCPQAVDLMAKLSARDVLDQFAHIDGQWLLDFPREESPERIPERTITAARKLRKVAAEKDIVPPRPYLAVVDFDGDGMGKWLSGTHEKFPKLWGTLHSKAQNLLQESSSRAGASADARKRLMCVDRLLTPAFHASLSAAAASFARFSAPMTIEGEGLPGHLVYAGGDDALFLAPVPIAVELAWRLRLRFSGWPSRFSGLLIESALDAVNEFRTRLVQWFDSPSPWVAAKLSQKTGRPEPVSDWHEANNLGLAFGTRATASAGVCVFHYRWPLGSALRMARSALEEAKSSGRNALGITIQRRSGSISKTVLPFFVDEVSGQETHPAPEDPPRLFPALSFLQVIAAFTKDDEAEKGQDVSTRLASAFRQEVDALHIVPRGGRLAHDSSADTELWAVGEALARRVVRRRLVRGGTERKVHLEQVVLELGRGIRAPRSTKPSEKPKPATQALFDWVEALTVAAFLARPAE